MPTTKEIANFLGVSTSTVSLALNDKPGVSLKMRQRVLSAMSELEAQERPSYAAPYPGNGKTLVIGFVYYPNMDTIWFGRAILQGIRAAALEYHVQLHLMSLDPQQADDPIVNLYLSDSTLRPDGLIFLGQNTYEPLIARFVQFKLPYIFLATPTIDTTLSQIAPDELAAGQLATNYLLDLGHQAIAFLSNCDESAHYALQRLQGYQMAMRARGLKPFIIEGEPDAAVQQIQARKPSGVILVNNTSATKMLPLLQAAGCRIPDALSVVMFDDTDFARNFQPPLTAIRYPLYEQGYWAVKTIVEQNREPGIRAYRIAFGATLIERASCLAVKAPS
jgi:LacI family transcriptional regulator